MLTYINLGLLRASLDRLRILYDIEEVVYVELVRKLYFQLFQSILKVDKAGYECLEHFEVFML